jgi:protein ImuB
MFACIHGRSVSESSLPNSNSEPGRSPLVDLAFTFSPLVEQTSADTVVLDVSGQDLLFGETSFQAATNAGEVDSAHNVANEIFRRAIELNLKVDVSVAANPDVAIHLARSCQGVTVFGIREVVTKLSALSIRDLDCSLVGIEADRVAEFQETFALWGIHTFGDLARLPLSGIAERLGQEGVRLQKLARGKTDRQLNLVRPPVGFKQSIELEHAIVEVEPLTFILSRLLNQLCANLHEYALATNELKVQLVTEQSLEYRLQSSVSVVIKDPTKVGALNTSLHERAITLPVPMRNPKTLLRLLLFDIEAQPPPAPIVAITIVAEPVEPRASQTGLFIPLAPEPEKLEITLARLAKLMGADKIGSLELLNTHRPDAFQMNKFHLHQRSRKNAGKSSRFALNGDATSAFPVMALRMCRPPWRAEVQTMRGQPTLLSASNINTSAGIRGKVIRAAGPWRISGEWWSPDVWARDEWDVAVMDSVDQQSEVICRIYRNMASEEWFVAGIYD